MVLLSANFWMSRFAASTTGLLRRVGVMGMRTIFACG